MRPNPAQRSSGAFIKRKRVVALVLLIISAAIALSVLLAVANAGYTPRQLAPWVERRSSGHAPWVEWIGQTMAKILNHLDRPAFSDLQLKPDYPAWAGAQKSPLRESAASGLVRKVADVPQLLEALRLAEAGDTIEMRPGRYQIRNTRLDINRAGRTGAPITLRAEQLGQVILEFEIIEGFHVQAPYWQFENLVIRGTCREDRYCEHAFHVTGQAHGVVIRNNRLEDFNAQIKINAENGHYPDAGILERNTLANTRPRNTDVPVTPIDLVAASNWRIEGNLIADFIKLDGNRVSYGGFVKGAGEHNRFVRNVVLCEHRLRGLPGQRVGLSLGGGGTGKAYCRDGGQCVVEQTGGEISGNLIAQCSDVGVYLNKAANSLLNHNTILDTAGVAVRYSESSAKLSGNLIDGTWKTQDGGLVHDLGNQTAHPAWAFLGFHPVRRLFVDAAMLDLRWRGKPADDMDIYPSKLPDLCGRLPMLVTAGAFAEFEQCEGAH